MRMNCFDRRTLMVLSLTLSSGFSKSSAIARPAKPALSLGAVGKKKQLRRVTQTYLFRCRIAVGIDPRAPFLSILPRKPLKCGKTAKMAVLRDLASWQLRGLK